MKVDWSVGLSVVQLVEWLVARRVETRDETRAVYSVG